MVPPRGVEPRPPALQAGASTGLASAAENEMVAGARLERAAFGL